MRTGRGGRRGGKRNGFLRRRGRGRRDAGEQANGPRRSGCGGRKVGEPQEEPRLSRCGRRERTPAEAFRLRRRAVRIGYASFILVCLFYLLYAFVLRSMGEPDTQWRTTSAAPLRYRTELGMRRAMAAAFPGLAGHLRRTYVIPGLRATETYRGEFRSVSICTSMTPQGMCVTEKYLFISAYCHAHQHNSVLYMLDRTSGNLIKTIVLPTMAHVGGLAYDPVHRNVWVSGGPLGAAKAVCYSLDAIEAYDLRRDRTLTAIHNYTLATIIRNSYMNYSDGSLLVGLYRYGGLSQLDWFHMTEDGGLKGEMKATYSSMLEIVASDFSATTSGEIQSVAVSGRYLLLSKSFGPFDSVLQIHELEDGKRSYRDGDSEVIHRFPQKLEQIEAADGQLYCLFESGAYAYRAQPVLCIDRVLVFDLADLLPAGAERAPMAP